MTPREFFPFMPDEVFESWLQPIIQRKGWPFTSVNDDLRVSEWRYILGIRTCLSDWFHAKWDLREINIREANWNVISLKVVKDIIANSVANTPTSTANVENTKERFWACAAFTEKHKTIPIPVVLLDIDSHIKILDGNHRLAAFIHVTHSTPPCIPAWVVKFR